MCLNTHTNENGNLELITILWLILLRTLSAGKSNGLLTWGEEGGREGEGGTWESQRFATAAKSQSEASFDF